MAACTVARIDAVRPGVPATGDVRRGDQTEQRALDRDAGVVARFADIGVEVDGSAGSPGTEIVHHDAVAEDHPLVPARRARGRLP